MRVQTTIVLLLILIGVVFVGGLLTVRNLEAEKFASVASEREAAWKTSVAKFFDSQRRPLETLVALHATSMGTLPAILDRDLAWAGKTWDDKMLSSFGANAVWVYRADGTVFYANGLHELPIAGEAVPKLFARQGESPHFYYSLPSPGDGGKGLEVVEVRGFPVRPVWDEEKRLTKPEGWFLAGRLWNEETLLKLLPPSGDLRVAIALPDALPTPPPGGTTMTYEEDLPDWQGRTIARIAVSTESPALASLNSRVERLWAILVIGVAVLLTALLLLLGRSVVRPLRLVIRGLHTKNLAPLEPLCTRNTEFGELARLIHAFFAQRTDLVREMNERVATEKALRQSEEMLRHSQKMEAVGRLAGGVAHDFNNLLTAIIGYATLLRQRLVHDPVAQQEAQLIHQAGEQAAGLTRQLLAFSRKQLLQPRVIDLNLIVTNLHRLLQRIIGEHIEICTEAEADSGCIKADPGQIEQVIVNLGVNARDAMPRGGRLTIRTANVKLNGEAEIELPSGEYVALEVTDTGAGMDAETRSRIFEPFFTTKGPGKGTGLGLATVYGIVRQSGGEIVVESEPGRGTTFRIYLPREHGAPDVAESRAVPVQRTTRAEVILVVEDEEIVRNLVCEVLKEQGYRVLGTDRGSEALRLVRNLAGEIDLLISDVVMPEMNGAMVAQRVREISPKARVLFVSGYSEHDMADQGLAPLSYRVLQKPFTPAALARKVREVLDSGSAPDAT
ncbi:MAG: hypothetical protein QOE70_2616 [Chthoniobacter sp.]|jgi:signal transduction histidine kinase/CheY-like chemotaxis protein|nr:hypothetical protein [Chthoniobacter sp.]